MLRVLQTRSGAIPVTQAIFCRRKRDQSVQLATHSHLVLILRTRVAINPLALIPFSGRSRLFALVQFKHLSNSVQTSRYVYFKTWISGLITPGKMLGNIILILRAQLRQKDYLGHSMLQYVLFNYFSASVGTFISPFQDNSFKPKLKPEYVRKPWIELLCFLFTVRASNIRLFEMLLQRQAKNLSPIKCVFWCDKWKKLLNARYVKVMACIRSDIYFDKSYT